MYRARPRAPEANAAAMARPDVVVHARSALLQGLLTSPHGWPAGEDGAAWHARLGALASELGRAGPVDLALAYVRAQPWITSVVVGMERRAQWEDNFGWFRRPALTAEGCLLVEARLGGAPERLLDPSRWKEDVHV